MNTLSVNITKVLNDGFFNELDCENNASDNIVNNDLMELIMCGIKMATLPTDNDNRKEEKA